MSSELVETGDGVTGIAAPTLPTFAVCYTVKNDARLLEHALPLVFALGASKAFVFFDGTTDKSRQIVERFPLAVSAESIRPEAIKRAPPWLSQIAPRWAENMDVRKRINTYIAAEAAATAGVDWLLCIDPDEVLVPSLTSELTQWAIPALLATVPMGANQILVPNYEVVPRRRTVANPFTECTSFTNRFSLTDFVWRVSRAGVRNLFREPKTRAWFTYLFYAARFGGAFPRLMRDPLTGAAVPRGYYLGYSNHKSLVRCAVAADLEFNVHKWTGPDSVVSSVKLGALLHYDLFDVVAAREKFRERNALNSYNADFHRNEIARFAREYPDDVFEQFFCDYVILDDDVTAAKLSARNILLDVESVRNLYGTCVR